MVSPKHVISSPLTSNSNFRSLRKEIIQKDKATTGEIQKRILRLVADEPFSTIEELSNLEEFKSYAKYGGVELAIFGLIKRGLLEQQKGESLKITKSGEALLLLSIVEISKDSE